MYWGILLVGLIGGILSGFLGIGGGTLIIPALVIFFGFSQKLAQGTSLAAMVPPIGILAAYVYWKAGNVDIKSAIFIASGILLGALIGGTLAQYLPDAILKKVFAVFLVIIAIKMWLK
ncbi:MAG: sulfite exporter TauE/SafE family protein [Gammaproteobacteria bacterium]|nr:sulfite exporter TauE/SafE family protein [Gammaproteobacteria bacterium]